MLRVYRRTSLFMPEGVKQFIQDVDRYTGGYTTQFQFFQRLSHSLYRADTQENGEGVILWHNLSDGVWYVSDPVLQANRAETQRLAYQQQDSGLDLTLQVNKQNWQWASWDYARRGERLQEALGQVFSRQKHGW